MLLVASAVAEGSKAGRAGVAAALERARISAGACGPARVGPGREVDRQPIVLRVEGGDFVVHDW
jgi:hypothetical protein